MALVVEDGTIVDGANTFILVADLDTYMADRLYTTTATAAQKEAILIRAYDFMRGLTWCDSHTEAFTVTDDIKNAQAEIAYRITAGADPAATPTTGGVKREKVDVLEIEYFTAQSSNTSPDQFLKTMPQAYSLLKPLLCSDVQYLMRA